MFVLLSTSIFVLTSLPVVLLNGNRGQTDRHGRPWNELEEGKNKDRRYTTLRRTVNDVPVLD